MTPEERIYALEKRIEKLEELSRTRGSAILKILSHVDALKAEELVEEIRLLTGRVDRLEE